jgi:hypothetical protein
VTTFVKCSLQTLAIGAVVGSYRTNTAGKVLKLNAQPTDSAALGEWTQSNEYGYMMLYFLLALYSAIGTQPKLRVFVTFTTNPPMA